jgi:NAD(P)-dependent dehydrogenase (short-subunit alcohol dehydrogenase family)
MTEVTRLQLLGASVVAVAAAPALAQTAAPAPSFAGRSILITGTSSSFGNLAATLFARSGAKVFATMRGLPRPEAEALRKTARDERLDVNKPDEIIRTIAEAERTAGYPELMANAVRTGGGTTDPMDVPRAMAEIIAMAPGTRPLRRPVHPGPRPQEPINQVAAQVQRQMLGRTPFAPWAEAVLG